MKLDHIAYRVADRWKTTVFFIKSFGYKIQTEFDLEFPDGSTTKCIALEHEGLHEIFVSDGPPDSIVGQWVAQRGGIGGIHHIAYRVQSVKETMTEWRDKGYAEFSSDEPLTCPGLTQVFTKPSELTGVIYEFIEREKFGFCKENVVSLMLSTKDNV